MKLQNNNYQTYDKVNFTAMKKSQFSGIDFSVVEKFKAPIEKFDTMEDFQHWAKSKYKELADTDFKGKSDVVANQRHRMKKEWNYMLTDGDKFTPAEQLLIFNGITKELKPFDNTYMPAYNYRVLKKTMNDVNERLAGNRKELFDFGKMYRTNIRQHYQNDFDENYTGWIVIPSRINDRENFDKNVMGAEEAQAQKLTEILEAIKGVELSPELKAALQALMNAVNSGAQNITNELNKVEELLGTISDKIDGLQETLDDIAANVRSIKTQVTLYNTYWTKALAGIDELVEIGNQLKAGQGDIKTLIAQAYAKMDEIIENQQKSNEYAKKAEADRAIIIEKLDKYKGIDYDQLEAMWKEHDNANFVRLEALLKSLGIDPAKFESVADLIAAINEKMQYIKDNERILKEISDKMDLIKAALDNLDPSSQEYKDYTAKLNRIIELLENFKCNCECNCGKSNEGIIDELNNLMNGDGNNAREYRAARRSAARHK